MAGTVSTPADIGSNATPTSSTSTKSGPEHGTPRWFAIQVLKGLGIPRTKANVHAFVAWEAAEGGHWNNSRDFNPLNTTLGSKDPSLYPGATPGGAQGDIMSYTSWKQGIDATVATLKEGHYAALRQALQGSNAGAIAQAVVNSPWGTTHISLDAAHTYANTTARTNAGDYTSGVGVGNTEQHLNLKDLAARYGFATAFFKSDPSLEKLIHKAVAEQWDPDTFKGHLMASAWYQKHTDAQQQWLMLSTNHPKEAHKQLLDRIQALRDEAGSLGINLDHQTLRDFAEKSLMNGLNDQQIQAGLAAHLEQVGGNNLQGHAGAIQDNIMQAAADYGVGLSRDTIFNWTKNVLGGHATQDNYLEHIQTMAKSAFPSLSKLIDQGQTVRQIADPYVQMMAQNLELAPEAINFAKDPAMRKAFGYMAQGQNEPSLMPLWQFDQTIKQDPRWLKTDNARNSLMDVTTGILKDWGLTA